MLTTQLVHFVQKNAECAAPTYVLNTLYTAKNIELEARNCRRSGPSVLYLQLYNDTLLSKNISKSQQFVGGQIQRMVPQDTQRKKATLHHNTQNPCRTNGSASKI